MSKMSKFFLAAAICAVALPTAAMADVIGTGTGSFSSLSNCDDSGTHRDCQITAGSPLGPQTSTGALVEWGSNSSANFYQPSTLLATTQNIDLTGSATGVKIAELTWYNSSTDSDRTPDSFGVHYTLTIAFTAPLNATGDSQTFDLTIDNTANPQGDDMGAFAMSDLSALSFSIPGWTVGNLQYLITNDATDPTLRNDDCGTSGNTKQTWCNPESNTANLFITADFTQNSTPVPEPMTLSLFGAGLAGAAAIRRRKLIKA